MTRPAPHLLAGLPFALAIAIAPSSLLAQIPSGHYVYGAFSPRAGQIGVFHSHPRNPAAPVTITNLQGDLTITGSACILYRKSDGAILVGERSPVGASIDLHVIRLQGSSVLWDASFSLGTGGPCCGEIPQMALLPDGRVVVAVTDVVGGPLANIHTTSYGNQGLGIVDTTSGLVSTIPISNGATIVDVFNGLAVARDGSTVYAGTYVSSVQGDIWSVPIQGGAATLVASVPAGLSNLAIDDAGTLWVTTLDAAHGLFKVDPANSAVTNIPQSNGALNAIDFEAATGNFAVASSSAGNPLRSVFWMEPDGTDHLLTSPGYGTLSGIAVHPNPEVFGSGTPGSATYSWQMPNPGGLPLVGNAAFSLTVKASSAPRQGILVLSAARVQSPVTVLGAASWIDLAGALLTASLPGAPPMTMGLPIPNDTNLIGVELFAQSFHLEGGAQLSASPGIEFTIL